MHYLMPALLTIDSPAKTQCVTVWLFFWLKPPLEAGNFIFISVLVWIKGFKNQIWQTTASNYWSSPKTVQGIQKWEEHAGRLWNSASQTVWVEARMTCRGRSMQKLSFIEIRAGMKPASQENKNRTLKSVDKTGCDREISNCSLWVRVHDPTFIFNSVNYLIFISFSGINIKQN